MIRVGVDATMLAEGTNVFLLPMHTNDPAAVVDAIDITVEVPTDMADSTYAVEGLPWTKAVLVQGPIEAGDIYGFDAPQTLTPMGLLPLFVS
jgi:hypothetical protein